MEIKLTKDCVGKTYKCKNGVLVNMKRVAGPHNVLFGYYIDSRGPEGDGYNSFTVHGKCAHSGAYPEWDLVEEVVKPEPGKFYRTRGGKKAFIAGKSPFEGNPFIFCGFVDERGSQSWNSLGKFYNGEHEECSLDLVADWVDAPKHIRGWINVHSDGQGSGKIYTTKEEADEVALPWRVACIEIDVLEGQGLADIANGRA